MFNTTFLAGAAVLILAAGLSAQPGDSPPLAPFVLPWDDGGTGGVTDMSDRPELQSAAPAGKAGFITAGPDGHLYAGGKNRIRFLGVNLCFGACFPRHQDADKIAARMARFGINCVRFHHMDTSPAPDGLLKADAKTFDPDQLDKLDYLVAQLKKHGIYANINLHVGRNYPGMTKWEGMAGYFKGVDNFHPAMIQMQKDYARELLTHVNPFTKTRYADEPAVAFVEINNENGLMQEWLAGSLDAMPAPLSAELTRQWNDWLKRKYAVADDLKKVWSVGEQPLGNDMLTNGDFSDGAAYWNLEQHTIAKATLGIVDDSPAKSQPDDRPRHAAKVEVATIGQEPWHVQLGYRGLEFKKGQSYTLSFWAKADQPRMLSMNISQAHDPWAVLGGARVRVTKDWAPYAVMLMSSDADANARLTFSNLGEKVGSAWLAKVSLQPGGLLGLKGGEQPGNIAMFRKFAASRAVPGPGVVPGPGSPSPRPSPQGEGGPLNVPAPCISERTLPAQRDWMTFLWQTENAYWRGMSEFIKTDCGCKAIVVGTIVGCSTPNLMAGKLPADYADYTDYQKKEKTAESAASPTLDAVDVHGYWQHPHFPGRPWDSANWTVQNASMVNQSGGVPGGLALRRVLGRPLICTEYNNPAPNTFAGEGPLLLAAMAAVQDWDAIFLFAYCHRCDDWSPGKIPNFFDIDQHPTKMANLPIAAAIFTRGDVRPADKLVTCKVSPQDEIELLRTNGQPWQLVTAGLLGVPPWTPLVHRVAIEVPGIPPSPRGEGRGEGNTPVSRAVPGPGPEAETKFVSDTGQLTWDLSRKGQGVVTIDSDRTKAVIGFVDGRAWTFKNGLTIAPGRSRQDWCTISLSLMQGDSFAGPCRVLIVATGYAENTDMGWKNDRKDTVGKDWGRSPSLVEAVGATITLPVEAAAAKMQAWSLDERGQRRDKLAVKDVGGKAVLEIGLRAAPASKTLWYEIVIE